LFCGENNTFGLRAIVVPLTSVPGRIGSLRTRRGSSPMKMTANGSASIFVTLLMMAPLSGCHGDIGDQVNDINAGPNRETPGVTSMPGMTLDGKPSTVSCAPNAGRSPLRRMNRIEYRNTVHDLLPTAAAKIDAAVAAFPLDEEKLGFSNNA